MPSHFFTPEGAEVVELLSLLGQPADPRKSSHGVTAQGYSVKGCTVDPGSSPRSSLPLDGPTLLSMTELHAVLDWAPSFQGLFERDGRHGLLSLAGWLN